MAIELILTRIDQNDKQTTGLLLINRETKLATLELPWRNNARNISRIPAGKYKAIRHVSPKFGPCLWLPDVPARSEILIHAGNYHWNTEGCILVGQRLADLNNDDLMDTVASHKAMTTLLSYVPDYCYITIIDHK